MTKRVPQLLVALVALFGLVAVVMAVRPDDGGGEAGGPGGEPPATSEETTGDSSAASPGPAPPSADPTTTTEPERPPEVEARDAAAAFLDRYVEDDGRVRRDPDGDTVSEGQAYAMLLAVASDDADTFAQVWSWTTANLLRRDGTLAWRWVDGVVVDPNAATDADLDAGRALLLAADRFGQPAYRTDALALGAALLQRGVIDTARGPVLVAGPWATVEPHYINPSYLSDVAFEQFAAASGDPRWQQLADTSNVLLGELTQGGTLLPSDWALVRPDGSVTPSAPPAGGTAAYGYDAFRTLPRLAEACDATSRRLAAGLAAPTARSLEDASETANLDGSPMTEGDNQLYRIAAAAGARAAGDIDRAGQLLDEVEDVSRDDPSYYLDAWVALGRVLLDTDVLGGCATAAPPPALTPPIPPPAPTLPD